MIHFQLTFMFYVRKELEIIPPSKCLGQAHVLKGCWISLTSPSEATIMKVQVCSGPHIYPGEHLGEISVVRAHSSFLLGKYCNVEFWGKWSHKQQKLLDVIIAMRLLAAVEAQGRLQHHIWRHLFNLILRLLKSMWTGPSLSIYFAFCWWLMGLGIM